MINRFAQQQMPNNDKDKFELACRLMAKEMQKQTGMPVEIAQVAAVEIVSDCMQATERLKERVADRWRKLSSLCEN